MDGFSDEWVRRSLGKDLLKGTVGPGGGVYGGVATDSRLCKAGDLFVALDGESVDGHAYIQDAAANGALAAFCRADWVGPVPDSLTLYKVGDPLAALRSLARARRSELACPVAAVAGSVGKTTTKELVAAMLRGRDTRVVATTASQNGHVGIPRTLLRAGADTKALVVEIGIDAPGAMREHMELVRPSAALVTAIAPEHLLGLGDMDGVTREEAACLLWVEEAGGTALLNLDDERLAPFAGALGKRGALLTFSIQSAARGSASHLAARVERSGPTARLLLSGLGLDGLELPLPLPGDHNARNLAGAAALARALGLSGREIERGLETFSPPDGRSAFSRAASGTLVLCDFYNASPASMAAAFATAAASQPQGGRLVACLGDMLELGPSEESYHRDLADALRSHGFAAVFCFGERMRWLVDELQSSGTVPSARHYQSLPDLMKTLASELTPADVLLIKGSRGMRLERVWDALREPRSGGRT